MALFNLISHKGVVSYDNSYVLEGNERSEVEQNRAKRVRGKRGRGAANKIRYFYFATLIAVNRRYAKA